MLEDPVHFKDLKKVLKDRFNKNIFFCDYIRYLNRVDPGFWTHAEIENEYKLSVATVNNILSRDLRRERRKRDRRKAERRKN